MSEWPEFAGGLVLVFRRVSERVILVVSSVDDGARYVQFIGRGDSITGEASGAVPLSDEASAAMSGQGWVVPGPHPNWTSELPLPALTAEYQAFADRCVFALRDAFGVVSPARLQYRAWRAPERIPEHATLTQHQYHAFDRGESPLLMPELGLPLEEGKPEELDAHERAVRMFAGLRYFREQGSPVDQLRVEDLPDGAGVLVVHQVRGGGSLYVAPDGSAMFAASAVPPHQALQAFLEGRRTDPSHFEA